MSPKSYLLRSTCLGAIMIASPNAAVVAQDDDEGFMLEEIIVTARLRKETLQTTPLSITAMTGDSLEKKNITDVRKLMDSVPGVYFTNQGGPGLGNVSMRGLTQGSLIGDEANVASFVDGFYWAGRIAFDGFIDGLERVEVVRGPQSALYGRNSFSGAINYITKKPEMDDTTGGIKATYGNHGRNDISGHLSTAIIPGKLGIRIDAAHLETGGTWVNPVNNERLNNAKSDNVRVQLEAKPTDNITMNYSFTHVDRNTTEQPLYGVPYDELDGGYKLDFITFSFRNHKIENPENRPDSDLDRHVSDLIGAKYKVNRHTFRLDYEAENFTMSTLIAQTNESMRAISDATYGLGGDVILGTYMNPDFSPFNFGQPVPIDSDGDFIPNQFPVVGGQPIQDRDDFSGEIRFQSNGDGPLSWAFGGFFARLKYTDKLETAYDLSDADIAGIMGYAPAPGTFLAGLFPATYNCDVLGNPGSCVPFPMMLDTWFVEGDEIQTLQEKYFENEETSVFLSMGYDIGDNTRINVEGRYTWEKRYMDDIAENVMMYDTSLTSSRTENYSSFTPRIIIDHKVNDDTFLYAVVGKGAKAGGIQPSGGATYAPEYNWTYEAGAKITMLDGHLKLNMAAFYVDWTDMQLRFNNGLTTDITNLGKAKVKGLEFMGAWRVHENVTMNFGYTYQDGEITQGNVASAAGYCDMPQLDHETVSISATAAGILSFDPAGSALCNLALVPVVLGPPGTPAMEVPFVSPGTISVSTGNIAGNRMSNAPKHTLVYGVDVSIPVNDTVSLFASADVNYRSQMYLDFENFITIPSTTLVSAQFGFETDDWRLAFWVNNLTNNKTPLAAIRNFNILGQSATGIQQREQRMMGATFSYNF